MRVLQLVLGLLLLLSLGCPAGSVEKSEVSDKDWVGSWLTAHTPNEDKASERCMQIWRDEDDRLIGAWHRGGGGPDPAICSLLRRKADAPAATGRVWEGEHFLWNVSGSPVTPRGEFRFLLSKDGDRFEGAYTSPDPSFGIWRGERDPEECLLMDDVWKFCGLPVPK